MSAGADFIRKATDKHGDKYDYSLVDYITIHTPVKIICRSCGDILEQKPSNFLRNTGCPCSRKPFNKSTEQFIEDAIAVHGDRYGYDFSVVYINSYVPVSIYCNECDMYFSQMPMYHLRGSGCQDCTTKSSRKSTDAFVRQAKKHMAMPITTKRCIT